MHKNKGPARVRDKRLECVEEMEKSSTKLFNVFLVDNAEALESCQWKTKPWRSSRVEEVRGLDLGEHGMEAYASFQIFTTQ